MDYTRLIESGGVFVAFIWSAKQGMPVVWRDLVIPIRDRFLLRFDRWDATITEMVRAAERNEDLLYALAEKQEQTRELCERMARAMDLQGPARPPGRRRRARPAQSPPADPDATPPPS